ncbi:MFS transporter [Candidatus Bipolaricaulota bacterium]|nr:MFS transporter [Candidatus Bipolaricaulota bacterium]
MKITDGFEVDFREKWTISAFLYLGLGAVVTQLRGALLPNFQEAFGVSESLLGLVSPAGTIGFTVVALTSGMIAGRVNIRRAIQVGALLTAITTFAIGLTPGYFLFLSAILLRGMAGGIPGGLTRPVLGHLYPDNRGQIFNLHEAVWAFGAACGPLLANLILRFADWRAAYYVAGAAFVPIFFLLMKNSGFSEEIKEKPITRKQLMELLKSPVVLGVGLALFLNVGVEGGFFTWLPYYLSQSLPQSVANLALTGFIGAYVPGRLLNSYLTRKFKLTNLILFSSSITGGLLVTAFFLVGGYRQILVIVAVGFFISTIFPNLFSLAANAFPEHSGPVNGLIMTFDPLGISTVPVFMGIIAESFGIQLAMRALVVPITGVIFTTLFLKRKIGTANADQA